MTKSTLHRCNTAMTERPRVDVSDKYCWWCPSCKTRKTIQEGSFFKKSHISLKQWLLLIHLWTKYSPVTSAAEDLEISRPSVVDAYQWLREVCSTKLLQAPIKLGGPGRVVQIDESLFRHKPKVCTIDMLHFRFLTDFTLSITEVGQLYKSNGCLVW